MLLDTSGLLCLLHRAESHHAAACAAYSSAHVRITHAYVLAEFVALAQARGIPRRAALGFAQALVADADVETVWVGSVLHTAAIGLLEARLDKSYSLCDAVSFVLMRECGIREALTTDRHFEQEGFRRLLV